MPADPIETYLNNHLAASVGALSLLDMLACDGDAPDRWKQVARAIHEEVVAEKQTLEAVIKQVGLEKRTFRQALGWLGEKAAELKLRWDDPSAGSLYRLEAVEAMTLGVRGKWLLWQGLDHARAQGRDTLEGFDFDHLMHRAEEQHQQLDAWRLDLVASAFSSPRPPNTASS